MASCGGFDVVDARGAEKVAAVPSRVAAARSENEGVTAVALWARASDSVEIAKADGEYVPVPIVKDGRTAVVIEGLVDRVFWRVQPGVFSGVSGPSATTGGTFAFKTVIAADNASVAVTIDDPLAKLEGGFTRPYTVAVDGQETTTSERSLTIGFAQASTDGRHAVSVTTDHLALARDVYTRPVLERFSITLPYEYEASPVIIVPIYDVDLPARDRCQAFLKTANQTIGGAAARASSSAIVTQPIVESTDCRRLGPQLSLNAVAARLNDAFLDPNVVPLLVLISNAPQLTLVETLVGIRNYARDKGGRLEIAVLGATPVAAPPGTFIAEAPWTYAVDPALPGVIDGLVSQVVPFRRYNQAPASRLVKDSFGGVTAVRLCTSGPGTKLQPALTFAAQAPPAGPLTATIERSTDFLPVFSFGNGGADVVLELCKGYCMKRAGDSWPDRKGCQ